MFGIDDPGIFWAYLLVILCILFAVVFGIVTWNKGQEPDEESLKKDLEWEKQETLIKEQET